MTGYVVSGYSRSISDHCRIHPSIMSPSSRLASTSVTVVVDVDVDRVIKVAAVFLRLFLSQSISSNNCRRLAKDSLTAITSKACRTLKCLVNIDGLLCTRLKVWDVAFGLAECHGSLGRNLRACCVSHLRTRISKHGHQSLPLACSPPHQSCFQGRPVDVQSANHSKPQCCRNSHTYKRKVGWISRRSLDQKLVSPAVQGLETLGVVDVVHQDAAVGSSVECDAQRLESLLSGGIPELPKLSATISLPPFPYALKHLIPAW